MKRINLFVSTTLSVIITAVVVFIATPTLTTIAHRNHLLAAPPLYWLFYFFCAVGTVMVWIFIHSIVTSYIPKWRCADCGKSDYVEDHQGAAFCKPCTRRPYQ